MKYAYGQLLSSLMIGMLVSEGEAAWKVGHFLEMIGQVDPFIPDEHKDMWRYELGNATKGEGATSEVHIFPGSSHAFSIKYSTLFYNALAMLVGNNASRPRPDMVINSDTADANGQTAIGVLLPPEGAPAMYPAGSHAAYYDHPTGTSATAFGKADAAMTAAGFDLSGPTGTDDDLVMEPHTFSAPSGETGTYQERASPPVPTTLSGFKIYQKSGPEKRPGLLIFVGPYGDGGGYYEREVAKIYAKKGMAVFLADYYPGTHGDANLQTMFPALAEYSTNPGFGGQSYLSQTARAQAAALRNLQQVQEWNIVDTSKIAVFGFCFGGAMGLQMARAGGEAAVVVSFHGEYPPPATDSKAVEMAVMERLGLGGNQGGGDQVVCDAEDLDLCEDHEDGTPESEPTTTMPDDDEDDDGPSPTTTPMPSPMPSPTPAAAASSPSTTPAAAPSPSPTPTAPESADTANGQAPALMLLACTLGALLLVAA